MPSSIDFFQMIACQQAGKQVLQRHAEPTGITQSSDKVEQYDRVMSTKLALVYAAGLAAIYQAIDDSNRTAAVDIACGPGHFTLSMAQYIGWQTTTGIDLSKPMVEIATQNAAKYGLTDRALFEIGDATSLIGRNGHSYDLSTFTDAAHHMPSLDMVTTVMREMNRITKPEGLVMVMDLVRLRTQALTEHYVNSLGRDYIARGLPAFFDDFRNSMYAAWTAEELREAIPRDTNRYWCHIVPRGLPTIQFVLGLPVGRKWPFVRRGVPWTKENNPIPKEMRTDWRMLRATLALASKTMIPPKT
ncbi:MAG: class I SAM-dependent methyltransferase [Pirellulaceae bacterium]